MSFGEQLKIWAEARKANVSMDNRKINTQEVEKQSNNLTKINTQEVEKQSNNLTKINTQEVEKQSGNNGFPSFEYHNYVISWMYDNQVSFLISSYKTSKVYCLGTVLDNRDNQRKISIYQSVFNRPMGLHVTNESIWISSSGNLWQLQNTGDYENPSEFGKFDANYIIRHAYFSNDVDTHDLCVDAKKQVYYCSAKFSCICVPSTNHSFKVWWRPPWINKIVPEDRCHLNGLCIRDGEPRYVTSVCQGNVAGAWRDNRVGKGIIYDIKEDQVVCEGLSMPHSPRWHDGKLWVLDAGTGYFGYVNFETRSLVRKIWIAGYLRGLSFFKNRYAVVGSSEDRHENVFKGLPLGDELQKNNVKAKCGIHIIDLKDYSIQHTITFYSPDNEFYDVCLLEGIHRPRIANIFNETANLREYNIDYGDYPNDD